MAKKKTDKSNSKNSQQKKEQDYKIPKKYINQEAYDEGRRARLAKYYDPGKSSEIETSIIYEFQFEQALVTLKAMIESYNEIDIDWGMDDEALGNRRIVEETAAKYRGAGSQLPMPGFGDICIRTIENAVRNYTELSHTYYDVCELSNQVKQTKNIQQIQIILSEMNGYLSYLDFELYRLLENGHKKEVLEFIRDIVQKLYEQVGKRLKRCVARYKIYDYLQSYSGQSSKISDVSDVKTSDSESQNHPEVQSKANSRLGRLSFTPRTVARGLETLEAYSIRKVNDEKIRRISEEANGERFKASCREFRKYLSRKTIYKYWLQQAEPVIKTENTWQGPGGVGFHYELPRDKAKIYAIVLLALDQCSSIKRLPENLQQTEFCKNNKNIFYHIEKYDLAPEYLAYIEADLREQGLLNTGNSKDKEDISENQGDSKTSSRLEKTKTRPAKKTRKKTPPQLLKESRERQAAQELAHNPDLTSRELGKILGCDASTVTRLKAWKNKPVLNYESPSKGFIKQSQQNDIRPDIEAIDDS